MKYIGEYAFYDCDYITAVAIPDAVVTIGEGAFRECGALTSVTFPKNLTLIGDFAFMGCEKLQNFVLPEGLVAIGSSAFDGCTALTAVTIPSTVMKLGDTAFYGCTALASVTANVVVTETDAAILEKMNAVLATSDAKNAADAFDALEAAGLYVGGVEGNEVKYVWDQNAKQIVGAFSASDASLVTKMNAALAGAKENPADTYKLKDLFTAAGLSADDLNNLIDDGKYSWNATTGKMELTYSIGKIVFHGASKDLTVYTNAGSPLENYDQKYYTVAPIPVA